MSSHNASLCSSCPPGGRASCLQPFSSSQVRCHPHVTCGAWGGFDPDPGPRGDRRVSGRLRTGRLDGDRTPKPDESGASHAGLGGRKSGRFHSRSLWGVGHFGGCESIPCNMLDEQRPEDAACSLDPCWRSLFRLGRARQNSPYLILEIYGIQTAPAKPCLTPQ